MLVHLKLSHLFGRDVTESCYALELRDIITSLGGFVVLDFSGSVFVSADFLTVLVQEVLEPYGDKVTLIGLSEDMRSLLELVRVWKTAPVFVAH